TSSAIYFDSNGSGVPHHIRFSGGEIRHAATQGNSIDGGSGSLWPHHNEWLGVEIHHNGSTNLSHGIYIQGNDNIVDGCNIHDNAGQGGQFYQLNGTPGSSCNRNVLRNSKIHDNSTADSTRCGFQCAVGTGNQIYDN